MDDEYKLINSPLSRTVTRDGLTIEVCIYRGEEEPRWLLEVVDQVGTSTVWSETFATEREALNEVYRTIDSEGMTAFMDDPGRTSH